MTREEIHSFLDRCLNEGKEKKLYGRIAFFLHFQNGIVRQITDTIHDSQKSLTRTSIGNKANG